MKIPEQPPNLAEFVQKNPSALQQALLDPDIQTLARRCEAEYWPWQKLKYVANAEKVDPRLVWLLSSIAREPRYKSVTLHGNGDSLLRFNVPDYLQYELMRIDQQLAGGLTSEDQHAPTASQRERFIVSALREEAIASSMLEGAATTRQDAKQMLQSGRRPRNRGERMVLNNYQAIQFIRENCKAGMSPEFMIDLQKILTDETLDDAGQVGRFRTPDDNIKVVDGRDGEVVHVPPPADELPTRLKVLCAFANRRQNSKDFIHPVIAACILHFQIGFDHPFCDGNGRTARALFYWMMLRNGYWLFEFLPISRLIYRAPIKYARAFLYCETNRFDITYFLMYKARVIRKARHELHDYIEKKQQQVVEARRLFSSDPRLNFRQQEIVLQATRNTDRFFTIKEHQAKFNLAYATARRDFLQLVKWKYLKKALVGRRFEFGAGERVSHLDR
jgi:Fic family protein